VCVLAVLTGLVFLSSPALPQYVPAVDGSGGSQWRAGAGDGGLDAGQPAAGKVPASHPTSGGPGAQPQLRTEEGELQPSVSTGTSVSK